MFLTKLFQTFIEQCYPLASLTLKVTALTFCLFSFGPGTVVSKQYLPPGWDIASASVLSTAMTLAPILPMAQGVDSLIASVAQHYGPHKELFALKNRLQEIYFTLSCATEKALLALLDDEAFPAEESLP